ncbi:MAG: DUF6691 family protein [Gemmatimonadota bacterium]
MRPVSTTSSSPAAASNTPGYQSAPAGPGSLLVFLLLGTIFGVLLIKSEVVSWFRIQEMFRFQGIHMYGILGSAVAVAALSLFVIRRFSLRSFGGETIRVPRKELGRGYRYIFGGTTFGLGWALTGACPGPILALVGYGIGPFVFVLGAALLGTWTYGHLRPRLPH